MPQQRDLQREGWHGAGLDSPDVSSQRREGGCSIPAAHQACRCQCNEQLWPHCAALCGAPPPLHAHVVPHTTACTPSQCALMACRRARTGQGASSGCCWHRAPASMQRTRRAQPPCTGEGAASAAWVALPPAHLMTHMVGSAPPKRILVQACALSSRCGDWPY